MKYEWDEEKYATNIRKHGIDFRRVALIFNGRFLSIPDLRHDYGEKRTISIGLVEDSVVVTVVYTDRNGVTRIISARPANLRERKIYYAFYQN